MPSVKAMLKVGLTVYVAPAGVGELQILYIVELGINNNYPFFKCQLLTIDITVNEYQCVDRVH